VARYRAHLEAKHEEALAQVGGADKLYDYTVTYNGFAAELTENQAQGLAKVAGVLAVSEDVLLQPDTSSTPSFLGLDKPGGLWQQAGGVGSAGEDVIVGIVDTGIWPEHPSFTDRAGSAGKGKGAGSGVGAQMYPHKSDYAGVCQPGEEWSASNCNNKLVGAQYFNAGFGADRIAERDYLSPRDWNGHGSHTASTAAGNNGVQATGDAALLGSISGMAPRARIAAYKVCWEDEGLGGCASSDSVAAIDQAVLDGVDVINFSISGTRTNFLDPVEVAFLFAADAGVFVSASAGNTAGASTVAHPSPWITTVAASTHDRGGNGTLTLGNGLTFAGASLAAQSVTAPLVDSEAAGLAGADATEVQLCYPGTLDPAKVTGKIVICDRGVIARTDKSFAVKEAGGVGMIQFNTANIGVNADLHYVPSIHIECADAGCSARAATKSYATTASPTATISKGNITTVPAPFMAGFSSAGPLQAGGGDLLKPDVTAPGVDVLAAVAPPGNRGRLFDLYSGTSMSSPHVAGVGAALKHLRPTWSPMMVKSALMTTGYNALDGNNFRYGAGHIDPTKAADPGLVYDSGFVDWLMFLQGQDCHCLPESFPSIDGSDLNMASIAIGQLAGKQTVTRTVTNVGSASETYVAAVSGLAGITAVVSPASFTIAPGATQSYTVEFTRTTAALNAYAFGHLTLTGDKGHSVRSPLAVRPVSLAAPATVTGTGTSGSTTYEVTFGYDGPFGASIRGLIAADERPGTVTDDPTNNFGTANPDANQGIVREEFVIPSGTTYARFSLFDSETDGNDDLDLYVYRVNADGSKTWIGVSGTGTSAEEVNFVNPAANTYHVYVHGWQTDGPDSNYTLFGWVLGSADAGNSTVTVDPSTATTGAKGEVTLDWTGLDAGSKYLGRVVYSGSSSMPLTTVRIDG